MYRGPMAIKAPPKKKRIVWIISPEGKNPICKRYAFPQEIEGKVLVQSLTVPEEVLLLPASACFNSEEEAVEARDKGKEMWVVHPMHFGETDAPRVEKVHIYTRGGNHWYRKDGGVHDVSLNTYHSKKEALRVVGNYINERIHNAEALLESLTRRRRDVDAQIRELYAIKDECRKAKVPTPIAESKKFRRRIKRVHLSPFKRAHLSP